MIKKTENNRIIQNLIALRGNILFIIYNRIKRWGDFYFWGKAYRKTTVFGASRTYPEEVQYNVKKKELFSKVYIPEYRGGLSKNSIT